MSKIKQPDSVKHLIANAAGQKFGDPSCRVRNPRITARESIEIADYIVALLEGEGTPPVDPSGIDNAPSTSPTGRLYADRDALLLDQLGGYYFRHVSGMTREQLHSKADIAAELAHRDMLIDASVARLTAVMSERAAEAAAYVQLSEALVAKVNTLKTAIMSNCYDDPSTSGQRLMELARATPTQALAVELGATAVEAAANSTRTAMTEGGAPWLCRYADLMEFAQKIRRGEA